MLILSEGPFKTILCLCKFSSFFLLGFTQGWMFPGLQQYENHMLLNRMGIIAAPMQVPTGDFLQWTKASQVIKKIPSHYAGFTLVGTLCYHNCKHMGRQIS
jgi:hypothetical protein